MWPGFSHKPLCVCGPTFSTEPPRLSNLNRGLIISGYSPPRVYVNPPDSPVNPPDSPVNPPGSPVPIIISDESRGSKQHVATSRVPRPRYRLLYWDADSADDIWWMEERDTIVLSDSIRGCMVRWLTGIGSGWSTKADGCVLLRMRPLIAKTRRSSDLELGELALRKFSFITIRQTG